MGETENPSALWFRDVRTCPWLPNQLFLLLETSRHSKKTRNEAQIHLKNTLFGNPKISDIEQLNMLGNTRAENPTIRQHMFKNNSIWDLYLPENMTWKSYRFDGLHLQLGWFASSAWVVCIFRLGALHLPLGWFASYALSGLHLPLGWLSGYVAKWPPYPSAYRLPPLHQPPAWGTRFPRNVWLTEWLMWWKTSSLMHWFFVGTNWLINIRSLVSWLINHLIGQFINSLLVISESLN